MPIIFQDFFNDTPGTLLSAHTPDIGVGWTEDFTSPNEPTPNVMEISPSGTEVNTDRSDSNARMTTITTEVMPTPNYQVTSTLHTTPDDPDAPFYLVARYTNDGNCYAAGGYRPDGGSGQDRGLVLFVIRTGTLFYLDVMPEVGLTEGSEIRFVCTDEIKAVYLNGNLVLSSTDNSITTSGHAGMAFGNWTSTLDDVDNDTLIRDFTVDTTIADETVLPQVPFVRVPTGPNSQVQLIKWAGLNETNRGEPFSEPRLTRKSIQVVGSFAGGFIRMEGALIPPPSPDAFAGMFITMQSALGLNVALRKNGVIDRLNHAFAYRPVVVSGSGVDLTLFLLSVER